MRWDGTLVPPGKEKYMIIAHIHVTGIQAQTVFANEIPADILGAEVAFTFDTDWDGLSKTVVFKGGQTVHLLNPGSVVPIPQEVLHTPGQRLYVGVLGTDSRQDQVIPTLWAELGQIRSSAASTGSAAEDPALPVWAQLQAAMGNPADLKTLSKENLVSAINSMLGQSGGALDEETLGNLVDQYLQDNPPAPGAPGKDGHDGISVTHSWNGSILTVTSASGTSSANLKGTTGSQGIQGEQGIPGKTAFQYAQDAGFSGTEADFSAQLAFDCQGAISKLQAQSVSLPSDTAGTVNHGTAGQFAVSDGNGGISWITLTNAAEVAM